MSARDQFLAQLRVIVDLAIEDNPDCPVFIADGLIPGGEVDDAQPPHANANWTFDVYSFVVRSAMKHGLAHVAEDRSIHLRIPIEFHNPSDPAHFLLSTHCA